MQGRNLWANPDGDCENLVTPSTSSIQSQPLALYVFSEDALVRKVYRAHKLGIGFNVLFCTSVLVCPWCVGRAASAYRNVLSTRLVTRKPFFLSL
jgi:hypothetical protein